MSLSGHQKQGRGATDVWLTPPWIINALGPFDLDPCSAVGQPWPTASRHLTRADDGLITPWHGFCWVNPPFGPDAEVWLRRLADHGNGIGLVPARTETKWFRSEIWEKAWAVLFLARRPTFHHIDGSPGRFNSGAPICLVGYGQEAADRLRKSAIAGTFVSGWCVKE